MRAELADRYRDEKVTIGRPDRAGRRGAPPTARRGGEAADAGTAARPSAAAGPDLAREVDPAWQLRIADSIEAGMTPLELTQWESNTLSVAVPAVAVDGSHLFVNYLGHILALDLKSGKLLWRTGSFHNLELLAMQPAGPDARSEPVRDRRRGRARLDAWAATSRIRTSWPRSS